MRQKYSKSNKEKHNNSKYQHFLFHQSPNLFNKITPLKVIFSRVFSRLPNICNREKNLISSLFLIYSSISIKKLETPSASESESDSLSKVLAM